jgi:hypothetical protein
MPHPADVRSHRNGPRCRRIRIVGNRYAAWRWRWGRWWWAGCIRPPTAAGDETRYRNYLTNFLQHFLAPCCGQRTDCIHGRARPQALSAKLTADYVNGAVRACSCAADFRAARAGERLCGVVYRLQLDDFQPTRSRGKLEHDGLANTPSDETFPDGR